MYSAILTLTLSHDWRWPGAENWDTPAMRYIQVYDLWLILVHRQFCTFLLLSQMPIRAKETDARRWYKTNNLVYQNRFITTVSLIHNAGSQTSQYYAHSIQALQLELIPVQSLGKQHASDSSYKSHHKLLLVSMSLQLPFPAVKHYQLLTSTKFLVVIVNNHMDTIIIHHHTKQRETRTMTEYLTIKHLSITTNWVSSLR